MSKHNKVRAIGGLTLAAAIVAAVAVGAAYAQAPAGQSGGAAPACQCPMMGRGGMMGGRGGAMCLGPMAGAPRGLAQLGLTEQQKTQIHAIFEGRKADRQALAERMRPARQALRAAIANGADEAAIRQAAAAVAAVEADMAVFRASVQAQVFAVLTPEQQARAKELQLQAPQRRMGRMGRGL